MIPLRLYTLALGAAAVAVAAYLLPRRKTGSFEDRERERRAWLDQVGRITDGVVIDVQETVPDGHSGVLLVFDYDVASVTYHASQDVTYLRQWLNLHACRLALPTSVKYDPRSPGNSMVISERWIGLREHPTTPRS